MGGYLAMHTNPPGGLAQYYRENVIGGSGAFVVQIDDFKTFGEAMMRKLVNEVADAGHARLSGARPVRVGRWVAELPLRSGPQFAVSLVRLNFGVVCNIFAFAIF